MKRAIEEREILASEANKPTIDRTWAVFDKDDLDKTEGKDATLSRRLNLERRKM